MDMTNTKKLTFASVSLACCFFLPLLTVHNPQANSMLCLMHIPVMVCGMMWRSLGCGCWGIRPHPPLPDVRHAHNVPRRGSHVL